MYGCVSIIIYLHTSLLDVTSPKFFMILIGNVLIEVIEAYNHAKSYLPLLPANKQQADAHSLTTTKKDCSERTFSPFHCMNYVPNAGKLNSLKTTVSDEEQKKNMRCDDRHRWKRATGSGQTFISHQ